MEEKGGGARRQFVSYDSVRDIVQKWLFLGGATFDFIWRLRQEPKRLFRDAVVLLCDGGSVGRQFAS